MALSCIRAKPVRAGRVLVAMGALVAVAACGVQAGGSTRTSGPRTPDRRIVLRAQDPPDFVYVDLAKVELRSPATGGLIRVLATFGESFTNNGLALSPDGSDVYVTLNGPRCRRSLEIERIATTSGKRTLVACGEQQAISPNGRLLAYATGQASKSLAIRDLATGSTHTIDLARLLGRSMDLMLGTVTWLRDGSKAVIAPGPIPLAVSASARILPLVPAKPLPDRGNPGGPMIAPSRTLPHPTTPRPVWPQPTTPGPPGSCSAAPRSSLCLIVVHVSRGGEPFAARRLIVRGISGDTIAGDGGRPASLLMAQQTAHRTVIDRISLAGGSPKIVRLVSLPSVLPMAFDARGDHLFYVVGHGPTALWLGRIGSGRLLEAHKLLANPGGPVAW